MENSELKPVKTLSSLYNLAYRAHTGTSFSPEKRAESIVIDYSEELDQDIKTLEEKGQSPERIEQYKNLYIGLITSWLNAKSMCLSTMIAGPSNFPVRRAEKANNRESAKYKEFREYRDNVFIGVERYNKKKQI